jgi:hypothetical protein
MGKSSIDGQFSIAMLVYRRVSVGFSTKVPYYAYLESVINGQTAREGGPLQGAPINCTV